MASRSICGRRNGWRTLAGTVVDINAELLSEDEINVHEFVKPKLARPILVDEHVDIRTGPGLVSCIGTEQIERSCPVRSQRRFCGFQLRNHLISRHSESYLSLRARAI